MHENTKEVRTVPGKTEAGETEPRGTVPGETAPGEAAPGEMAPGEMAPGGTAPGEMAPGETAPGTAEPTMRALTRHRYGPPSSARVTERPEPKPGPGEVLLDVRAASVNPADVHIATGDPYIMRLAVFGLRRPKNPVLGMDVAGQVVALGPEVTGLRIGDEVFGEAHGSLAERAVARADRLCPRPSAVPPEQASALPVAGCTALQVIRLADVKPGQRVLITGASGGVGALAVQLAARRGAEVTAVCGPANVEWVAALGAGRVVDYTRQPLPDGDPPFDLILDSAGRHSLGQVRQLLARDGMLITNNGSLGGRWVGALRPMLAGIIVGKLTRSRIRPLFAAVRPDDLRELAELVAAGDLTVPIAETYPLDQAAAALQRVADGHPGGKLILKVIV